MGSKQIIGGWRRTENQDRVPDDLYPTPPEATECLIRKITFQGAIWECASGLGDISRVFEEAGHEVISTDLRASEYRYGETADFLALTEARAPNIVTNPPYKLLREFLRKAFTLPGIDTFTFLIPLPTLTNAYMRRYFAEFGAPARILVIVPQLKIYMGARRGVQQSFFAHCWVHWDLRGERRATVSEFELVSWRATKTKCDA